MGLFEKIISTAPHTPGDPWKAPSKNPQATEKSMTGSFKILGTFCFVYFELSP
jgi:hypothetical protein